MKRWISLAVICLIPTIYIAGFLAMTWVRSQQGNAAQVYPSEIEALAIHKGPVIRWPTRVKEATKCFSITVRFAMARAARETALTPVD